MNIQLNGKEKEIDSECTVLQLLNQLDLHPQKVAVELNREIIKRDRYEQTPIHEGDEIEVVHFVGGGKCSE